MPGGEGLLRGALGLGAVEVAHAEQAAAADGQNAAGLLEARVPGLVIQGIRVAGQVVKHHNEPPHEVAVFDIRPDQQQPHDAHHDSQKKPPLFHAPGPGHHHKDDGIGQGHAEIAGGGHNQTEHHQRVPGDGEHRRGAADAPPLPQLLHLPGQQQYKGELGQLRRLEVHRAAGDVQPAVVARLLPAGSQRGQQEQVDEHAEEQEPFPGFFRKQFNVHRGQENIGQHTQQDARRLDDHAAHPRGGVHVPGGAVDEHQAKSAGQQAESQQQPVAPLQEGPDGISKPGQVPASLPFFRKYRNVILVYHLFCVW